MAHVMILGQTMSGKSTLAKKLSFKYREKGLKVIVYDPLVDKDWDADFISHDKNDFFNAYVNSRSCAVFIDEVGDLCKTSRNEMTKTATFGRHLGHRNHYIAQRGTLILRTMRDQCTNLFLFNTGLEDSKIHAAEWNDNEIKLKAPALKKGEYFFKERLGELKKLTLGFK